MSDLSRSEFEALMSRNDFVLDRGLVVCSTCYGNCGQCGVGRHQSDCQAYYDLNKDKIQKRALKQWQKRVHTTRAWWKRIPKPSFWTVVLVTTLIIDVLVRLGVACLR